MSLFEKQAGRRYRPLLLAAALAIQGGIVSAAEPATPEPTAEPTSLMGEWCREKKRMITQYTVSEGKLRIRGGRSGQLHEADLACDDGYTECKAQTIRGWGTPVTEILRVDGGEMDLTRIWGGSWKDKTYNFTFTRCPKW